MKVIRQPVLMSRCAQAVRRKGRAIGFVPTMGALHDGHLSLIRAAAGETDLVVVSIFVNPLQFGPTEDYARYPRTLKRDLNLAKAAGAEVVFAPDTRQIYLAGFRTHVEVEGLSDQLEGAHRPGHFRGVATIVAKLFHLIQPSIAYFGLKDYQQALIIQRMVKDLDWPIQVRLMPTIREPDGLAMSSRNAYLSDEERRQAPILHQALQAAKKVIRAGEQDPQRVSTLIQQMIATQRLARLEEVAIVDAKTLEPVPRVSGHLAILLSVGFGSTRLIDNLLVDVS